MAGAGGGDFGVGAVSQFWGGTRALATNDEKPPYGRRGVVGVVLTNFKGGFLDSGLLLNFEDNSFDRLYAWVALSGLDGGGEGTCFPLDCRY